MSGDWIKVSTPHWAMVVAAARGARRAWPYFASDPMADAKARDVIARGIVVAEECAERGRWCNEAFHLLDAMNVVRPEADAAKRAVRAAVGASHCVYSDWAYSAKNSFNFCVPELRCFKDPIRNAFKAAVEHDERFVKERSRVESWSHVTPIDREWFGELWPEGLPDGLPVAEGIPSDPRPITPPEGSDAPHGVPDDCLGYLSLADKLQFDAEGTAIGNVYLKRPEELEVLRVDVLTSETDIFDDDPNKDVSGEYQVRVVNLIAASEAWHIVGPLLWYPDEQSYGTWDFESQVARLFPEVNWGDIVADPSRYLDDLWAHENVGVPLRAWKRGVFKPWRDE